MISSNLPVLPTDNLYKFYSIAGIIIVILYLSFMYLPLFKLRDRMHTFELQVKEYVLEVEHLDEDREEAYERLKRLENKLSDYELPKSNDNFTYEFYRQKLDNIRNDTEYRKYLEFIYEYDYQITPGLTEYNEIEDLSQKIKETSRKISFKKNKIELTNEKIKLDFRIAIFISFLCLA